MMEITRLEFYILTVLSIIGFFLLISKVFRVILFLIYKSLYRKVEEQQENNSTLSVDIEPCPICGSPSIELYKSYKSEDPDDEDAIGYICKCSYCGLSSPLLREPKDAVNYWNTRDGKLVHEWKEGLR